MLLISINAAYNKGATSQIVAANRYAGRVGPPIRRDPPNNSNFEAHAISRDDITGQTDRRTDGQKIDALRLLLDAVSAIRGKPLLTQ